MQKVNFEKSEFWAEGKKLGKMAEYAAAGESWPCACACWCTGGDCYCGCRCGSH